MQLTDVMATHVLSVSPETTLGDAARRMVEADVGAAVVTDAAGDLAGVITERDLMRCVSDGTDPATPVEQRMTRHVLTASPETTIPEAMALMVDGHFRHLPVVNDESHVIGIVSMRDLMAYTSLRLRGGNMSAEDDLDPAEVIATIFRMRTGAA
jgi:CBS domain-containing protein